MKVGFIGLGSMGSAMASTLIKAGFSLTLYNRTLSRAESFRALGAAIAETPAQAAAGVDALITMLADDAALQEVIFTPGMTIDSLARGAVHVSMSTISIALSRKLAEAHSRKQQHYISAPVFGRPDAAAAAKLFVVAAGVCEQIERCRRIFEAMSQKTFVVGEDPVMANVVKLAGNFMISTAIESMAEAFALARKSGVQMGKLFEVLTGTLFDASVYRNYGKLLIEEKFDPPGFKLPLGLKDNRLLIAAAEEASAPMPMASVVHDRFLAALALGLGEQDWSAIARVSYRDAGL